MSEIATNIERIYPDGAPSELYVFAANTTPPRFATVAESEYGYGHLTAAGPLSEEQLAVVIAHSRDTDAGPPLTGEEHEARYAQTWDYGVEIVEMRITGNYPGGRDQAALNVARFVLGFGA